MTVSTLTNKATYTGNGAATSFAVPFKVLDTDHLVVQRLIAATNAVDYTYVGTQYSYSGLGDDSGILTLSGAALSSTYKLSIERIVPYTQDLDIVNAGGFYPETVEEQLDLTTMQIQQVAEQADDLETRALLVPEGTTAPSYEDFAAVFAGAAGSNVESLALFTTLALGLTPKPTGTNRYRSAGYSVAGKGQADYANSADVDEAYVALHPRTSFLWLDGTGAKLAETVRTPYMFGAVGVQEGDTDLTMADDYLPLQAFFNDAFWEENRRFTYDLNGDWATSQGLIAAYPIRSGTPQQDHVERRFHGGKIRALPLSRLPGGVPITYVLTIAGHHQCWSGLLCVSGMDQNGACPAYLSRRGKYGIRLFFATQSTFEKTIVEGFQRDGVYFDPSDPVGVATDTYKFQEDTPFEVAYAYSNNIGVRFNHLFGRNLGSYNGSVYTKNWTTLTHGGLSGGAFDPTPASYTGSTAQRTKLTFDTTAEFRQYDYGKVRLELLPATYGTIAASAAAGTFTWSAGDPVAAGLVVGDRIIPQSGLNTSIADNIPEYVGFEIIGFSGGSNRTITVWPKPVDEAATAITGLFTRWSPYLVSEVLSATEILVWPWMADRMTSTGKWTFMHGHAANVIGSNTANVSFGLLFGLNVGGTLNVQTLYGCKVGTMEAESSETGVVLGYGYSSSNLGAVIEHGHFELCEFNIIQATAGNSVRTIIKGGSNFFKNRCYAMNNKDATTDVLMPPRPFNFLSLDEGGEPLSTRQGRSYSGVAASTFTVTNRPGQRICDIIKNGPVTVTFGFDDSVARLFSNHHWAEINWTGPGGAAPTSDLDFALDTELTHRGWTIVGTDPISGPAKPLRIRAQFYREDKKILLSQFAAL